jgi:hypothetical protein
VFIEDTGDFVWNYCDRILYFDFGSVMNFIYALMRIYGLIIIMARRTCVLLMFFPE